MAVLSTADLQDPVAAYDYIRDKIQEWNAAPNQMRLMATALQQIAAGYYQTGAMTDYQRVQGEIQDIGAKLGEWQDWDGKLMELQAQLVAAGFPYFAGMGFPALPLVLVAVVVSAAVAIFGILGWVQLAKVHYNEEVTKAAQYALSLRAQGKITQQEYDQYIGLLKAQQQAVNTSFLSGLEAVLAKVVWLVAFVMLLPVVRDVAAAARPKRKGAGS